MKVLKISFVTCLALIMTVVLLLGFNSKAVVTSADENETTVSEATTASNLSDGDASGKEESVYVMADANGKAREISSGIWLKNGDGRAKLYDKTSLKDIEVTKGGELLEQRGEAITWKTDGSDIYYQGTSKGDLPIEVNIDYYLDGKKVDAESLAGKSGHLKIDFSYKNKTATKKTVNGKEVTLYQPFTAMSGLMLSGNKASNVKVVGGREISTADNGLIMGMAMPGLKESLGLNEMKDSNGNPIEIDIPESISIEADVTEFELITTITIVDNSMFEEIALDDIDSIEDLRDSIRQLKDASGKLKDGSNEFYDGAEKLDDGSKDLSSAAAKIDEAMEELYGGANELKDGAAQLKDGTGQLPGGAAGIYKGLLAVNDALKGDENKSIYEGIEEIESGVGEISKGLKSDDEKEPGIYEAAGGIKDGAESIAEGADEIAKGAEQIKAEISGQMSDISAQIENLHNMGVIDDMMYSIIKGALNGYNAKMEELYAALDQMKEGADAISKGAKSDDVKSPGIYEAAGGIESGAEQLKEGTEKLKDGAGEINNGIDELTGKDGIGALIAGIKELENGANAIDGGAGALKEGVDALADGAKALKEGTSALADGSTSLSDGISKLMEGAAALRDGITAFDEEGIKKLEDLSEGDLADLMERLKAVKKLAQEYNTFSGIKEGTPGSVRFIFRTESIEK